MPSQSAIVFQPLIAALLYALGALVLKRSSDLGVGLWRTTFVVNMVAALVFALLWPLLGGPPVDRALLWQPALIGTLLFIGQIAQFLALERGDVSVAVPVFGLKVILVAMFLPFLVGESVSAKTWLASLLSVLGIALLGGRKPGAGGGNLAITLLSGGVGAVSFAIFDVLVQKWGPSWGAGRLLPLIFAFNALFSLSLMFGFSAPLAQIPRRAWSWLGGGSVLLSVQSVVFVGTVAKHGAAASANIMYASRGLLSVLLVWVIGHWFSNSEQSLGAQVLRWRLAGAALMLSAMMLVLW